MIDQKGRTAASCAIRVIGALCLVVLLVGCGEVGSSGGPAAAGAPPPMSTEESIAAIMAATPNPITPEQVAEAFALGTNATDVQREMIERDLVGSVVEWTIQVYDVEFTEGRYKVMSQAIPIQSTEAVQLLRVAAFVQAQSPKDDALLRAIQTGDALRIRGMVREIQLRTVLVIWPGVVVVNSEGPP
jgi:hypothetical protein